MPKTNRELAETTRLFWKQRGYDVLTAVNNDGLIISDLRNGRPPQMSLDDMHKCLPGWKAKAKAA